MTSKLIKRMIIFIILLAITFVLVRIVRVQDIILRQVYPIKYEEYVEKYASQNGLDKYMVYAIIKTESNFKADVKSESNAIGLMQLLETTAVERANYIDEKNVTEEELYEPETNIKLGTDYYAYLLNHYAGNNVLALVAYNAGMGNVDTWVKEGVIEADGSDIENIPYRETNNYVRKILRDYKMYIKLYERQ